MNEVLYSSMRSLPEVAITVRDAEENATWRSQKLPAPGFNGVVISGNHKNQRRTGCASDFSCGYFFSKILKNICKQKNSPYI
jgi:hypothetical protein